MEEIQKNPFPEPAAEPMRGSPPDNKDPFIPGMNSQMDGKIILNLGNNNYEARGDFYPAMENGKPLSGEYIRTLLEQSRIVYGINQEEIDTALEKCEGEKQIVSNVLMAKGDLPINEIPEYMQFNPLLGQYNTPGKDDDSVDHKARSPFIIVKKDQAVAKQKSRKPGKEGINVFGETEGFHISRPESVSAGENTRMDGRFLLAAINGQLIVENGVINIRNSLVIKGGVGYGTGNIIFPGDVTIDGPVSDGFKIYSGGTVTIKQTFDVTDVITKEDLNVMGGIIGRGQALVKVGGNLRTKFIENCRVACRNKISVSFEIINSHIFTLEILDMGEKGRIVGGEIYALKGVIAGGIGKKTGKAARIFCGVDFTLEQEKEKNNSQFRILAAKLEQVKEFLNDPSADGQKKEKLETLKRRLEEEQEKTREKISELLGKVNSYRDACVEVKGEIVSGTLIEICQTQLYVTETLKRVRIKLDRDNNRL
ncbi:MAG: FapA family protein, partial [Treponema sp.]|nr:FapA family protein [Treponema sp.]